MEQNNKNLFVCMTKEKYEQMVRHEDHLKNMITELIKLHEEETRLKRHHRAYLHVRDYINVVCDADKLLLEKMQEEAVKMPSVVLSSCDCAGVNDPCDHQESSCKGCCESCEACEECGGCGECGKCDDNDIFSDLELLSFLDKIFITKLVTDILLKDSKE